MNTTDLADWTRLMAQNFTSYPDDLQIIGNGTSVAIKGHRADYGKLLGKAGKHLNALKTILSAIAQSSVDVTVLESNIGDREEPQPFQSDPKWTYRKEESLMHLLSKVCLEALVDCKVQTKGDRLASESGFIVISRYMTMELEAALYTIFRAIGNSRGRKVTVEGRQA